MGLWSSIRTERSALPLRWALGASFGALTLALASLASFALVQYSTFAVSAKVEASLNMLAANVAQAVQIDIGERRREIELAALAREFRDPVVSRDEIRLFLRRLQEISPHYAFIGFMGPDGHFLATSNRLAEDIDVSSRDYWIFGRKDVYVSDAHEAILLAAVLGAVDATPRFVDIAAPVRGGGRLVGVLAAHLSSDWARDIAARVMRNLPEPLDAARIEILDASQTRLFSTAARPGKAISEGGWVASPALAGSPDDSLVAIANIDGIGENGRLHWTVRAGLPRAVALADLAPLRRATGAAAIAFVVTALMSGWFLGGVIARRLERLTGGVMRSDDEPPPILRASGIEELDDLGSAIRLAASQRNSLQSPQRDM